MAHFYQRARRMAYGTPSEQAGNALGKDDGARNEDTPTSSQTKDPLDTTSQKPPETTVSRSSTHFPRMGTKLQAHYHRRSRSSQRPDSPSPTTPAVYDDSGNPGSEDKKKSKTWPEMTQVDSPTSIHPSRIGSKLDQKTSPASASPPSKDNIIPNDQPGPISGQSK